jgi:hypothetical protein
VATITLTDLIAGVRLRMNSYSTDTRLTDAVITGAINDAIRKITLEHDWFWLVPTPATISTIAGTKSYSLPAAHLRTKNLVLTDTGDALVQYPITDLDRVVAEGRPQIYAIEGSTLYLAPTPDAVYAIQHRYFQTETPLTSGSDTPLIPKEFSEGIIQEASKNAARFIKDSQLAQECAADYNDWLKTARDNNLKSKEPMRVRVRPGAWV